MRDLYQFIPTFTCTRYDGTGKRGDSFTLALPKSDVAYRVLQRLQKSEPGFDLPDLEAIDSGGFSWSKLTRLFTPEELRHAIARRRESLARESSELIHLDEALDDLLNDEKMQAAQGGDAAVRASYRKRA